ncbi:hypothetical protein ACTXT7_003338 [Hymenolepis weldensis]
MRRHWQINNHRPLEGLSTINIYPVDFIVGNQQLDDSGAQMKEDSSYPSALIPSVPIPFLRLNRPFLRV